MTIVHNITSRPSTIFIMVNEQDVETSLVTVPLPKDRRVGTNGEYGDAR